MKNLLILVFIVAVYLTMELLPFTRIINFPIDAIVTFMHEFGHAFFTVITGGHVYSITLSGLIYHPASGMYAAGLTETSGGIRTIGLMGGYVGSAIFGNILLSLSLTKWARTAVTVLGLTMVFTAFFWYHDMITVTLLLSMAIVLFLLARTAIGPYVLQFIGVASLIYIVRDFNVGPTGDIEIYNRTVSAFPPASVMMIIWLGIVLVITAWNVKNIIETGFDHRTVR